MTASPFTTPRADIARDRWGRPLVVPPGGGNPVAYTRTTTYVGVIEDTFNLSRWQMRMVALGVVDRPDLQLAVASHRDDKAKLNQDCENALEAAKAHAAATTGTALHALAEQLDTGVTLGAVPNAYAADLTAYQAATAPLTMVSVEQFSVLDDLRIGGTPDRVVEYDGKRYIADLKTGTLDFGYLKIAAQLAVYARAQPYDIAKAERLDPHGAEVDRGIVIHLPAGTGTCELYWIDLLAGWDAVRVCKSIREKRAIPKKRLVTPFGTPQPLIDIATEITKCLTADAVRSLWSKYSALWNDDLTAIAKAHIDTLPYHYPATETGDSA